MTHLRQLMLDELQRRNYAQSTVRSYLHAVEDFARYFNRSPDRLRPNHIREYQVHLFRDRKLSPGTIEGRTAALRFFFVKTLRRPYLPDHIPFPKRPRRLPTVLSQEEVERLIDSTANLMHRAMVMTLYATGLRRAELCRLKVCDIDSERMVIHVRQGKGGRDRDVLLSPKLLQTLREYWRWMKPRTYLFPGTVKNWRADVPVTTKIVWVAVTEAARRAGITKRVSPHTLRQAWAYYTTFQTPFILKRICLDRRVFAEVYGRHDVPLSLLVVLPEAIDPFSR
ncbi:MAG TPA: site-specific integrase [Acidobacteriaceae bacterium]